MSHYPCYKRFDLFYHQFSLCPDFNHIYSNICDYQSCKLAPISFKKEYNDEKLPSIRQLHIPGIRNYEDVHCTTSSQDSKPSIVSSAMSSSSSVRSNVCDFKADQIPIKDLFIFSRKLEERGNKLRLYVSKRTYINEDQTEVLNEFYTANKYPTHGEKLILSKHLNLPERTIQIWFQNKRQNRTKKSKFIKLKSKKNCY